MTKMAITLLSYLMKRRKAMLLVWDDVLEGSAERFIQT